MVYVNYVLFTCLFLLFFQIQGRSKYDWSSIGRIATVGAFLGPIYSVWYTKLDKVLPGTATKTLVTKVVLDQGLAGVFGVAVFFGGKNKFICSNWQNKNHTIIGYIYDKAGFTCSPSFMHKLWLSCINNNIRVVILLSEVQVYITYTALIISSYYYVWSMGIFNVIEMRH